MQSTQVWSLVWEDPTCRGATKPVCHNYWAHMPQLLKPAGPKACAPQQEKPPQQEACAPQLESSPHLPQLEKAHAQQLRTSTIIIHKFLRTRNKRQFHTCWIGKSKKLDDTPLVFPQWEFSYIAVEKILVKITLENNLAISSQFKPAVFTLGVYTLKKHMYKKAHSRIIYTILHWIWDTSFTKGKYHPVLHIIIFNKYPITQIFQNGKKNTDKIW